jgi:serine/threonine-protein kinase
VIAIAVQGWRKRQLRDQPPTPVGIVGDDRILQPVSPGVGLNAIQQRHPYGPSAEILSEFSKGSHVANYLLEERIGDGGMAVVYRAHDEVLRRTVALKIMLPQLASDDSFRHRFIRESRMAAAVDDPHIIPVFQAGEANGILFIAMRYVAGGSVLSLLKREGSLSTVRTVAIISAIASALDAAHSAGLVHRDVKPANMLLDVRAGRPDHVYLSDFGISKGMASSLDLTGKDQFLGTLLYSAPEQIECGPVSAQTDEYALACTAFELLTGISPFLRNTKAAILHAQLSEPPPQITDFRPDLSSSADRIFAQALAKRPLYRYHTCSEFADALHEAFTPMKYSVAHRPSRNSPGSF